MSQDSPHMLVVDDDEFNRNLLVRHLRNENYENVETAENGRQALEVVRGGDFDLIFLDVEMPEMDGHAVLERLKSDMRARNIPVIMISGKEEEDSVVKCIELGAEDFLPKPFNPVMLRARTGASLEKKRLRDKEVSYLEELNIARSRSDELLSVILPSAAAGELKATGSVKPRSYDNVALLFCDVVGFTAYCDGHDATEIVTHLQKLFEQCEDITTKFGLEKIKTIGDEYMASCGLLTANPTPLLSTVKAGFDMAAAARDLGIGWEVRIGVHIGPVVAGVVGRDKYQFDVWGDTVNTAARMAGLGDPGTVVMTDADWMQVQGDCEGRSLGRLDVKGKGLIEVVECYALR